MYYLDTSVCADILRGRLPLVEEMMQASDPALFAIPAIVEAELRLGVERSERKEKNQLALERFLGPMAVVPFGPSCALQYAMLCADLQKRGCVIGPNDMLIAATAMANNAVLVSGNVREFKRVKGLMLEYWGEIDF